MRKVTVDALRRNRGLTTYEAVTTELQQRQERGEFIGIIREQHQRETTTQRMLEMERSNLEKVIDGQGIHQPIIGFERARRMVNGTAEQQHIKLNKNQRPAVQEILTSPDPILV